jgi:hypothetical protein
MSSGEADAYRPDKFRGLAAEDVPYPHETSSYWYTKYLQGRVVINKLLDHHNDLENDAGACTYDCEYVIAANLFLTDGAVIK